ncbi:MAG: altronate dehydratase family protein [Planctomycetota bacterium]
MSNLPDTVRLAPDDNVVVARHPLASGHEVPAERVRAATRVPMGHKLATRAIPLGDPVIKYGQVIGFATAPIAPGDHVHVHNCGVAEFSRDYHFAEAVPETRFVPAAQRRTFDGYLRSNGKVGTRNYLGVVSSVNCSSSVARFVADAVQKGDLAAGFGHVDGVVSFVHGTGCGMADKGDAWDVLRRTLWGYACHPNLAGVLFVGLGCEVFQLARMKSEYGVREHDLFRTLTIQESGGTRRAVEAGVAALREMLPSADRARRTAQPASELMLALQCGGSDAYSGITANPALGAAADLLVANGGTAVLSETPEIYGAEHLLTRRAVSREVGEQLIARIRWWEDYTARNRMEMNNNPSPGNKEGGLTTILEKSLGAAAKGGTTALCGVYQYAEPIKTKGFVFMDSPGYDPCSITGQVASGANVVCFTTGRGSAFGYKPAPSIKLTTSTELFTRMEEDMDLNCGDVLDGVTIADKGAEIFEEVLAVASGKRTKSELLGYGDSEFVPWQIGATM